MLFSPPPMNTCNSVNAVTTAGVHSSDRSRICQMGGDHVELGARAYNRSLGQSPQLSRGAGGDQGA